MLLRQVEDVRVSLGEFWMRWCGVRMWTASQATNAGACLINQLAVSDQDAEMKTGRRCCDRLALGKKLLPGDVAELEDFSRLPVPALNATDTRWSVNSHAHNHR